MRDNIKTTKFVTNLNLKVINIVNTQIHTKMKKPFIYLSVILIGIITYSFSIKSKKFLPKEFKELKAVVHVPSGLYHGQKMSSFFMFTEEVSNFDYLEFIYFLTINKRADDLIIAQVDSSLWNNVKANGNEFYAKKYHKIHDYPVVNISKQAAELYCEWLSEVWNSQQDKYEVEFRLPTEKEWEYAALGGKEPKNRDYPWDGKYCKNSKGEFLAQHKAFGLKFGPAKTHSFLPNEFGLYNMSGNVSEMIQDKDITKGGAWNNTEKELKIISASKIEKSPYVGFRPILILKEK